MGIQINGQTDTISATDGSFTISGASGNLTGDLTGNVTGNVTGNLTGTASTATAAATAYGLSGSPTLSIGAGSTSAPSLSPSGDSNTGIFFPSADTIAFGEGGAEAARIDSSGRLLMGTSTTSTNGRLCVQMESGNGTGIVIRAQNTGGGGSQGALVFEKPDGTINSRILSDIGTGYFSFQQINTSGTITERISITNNGNVTLNGGTTIDGLVVGYNGVGNNINIGNPTNFQNRTTGYGNVGLGYNTFPDITTGSENVVIGYAQGFGGWNITTGIYNSFYGIRAGEVVTTGNGNICIGYYANPSASSATNQIVIGTYDSTGKGNNTGFINPNGGGVYQGNNSSSWSTTSDRRLKKNIVDNTEGLDIINQVRVVNFEYRLPEEIEETDLQSQALVKRNENDEVTGLQGTKLGVIAQELQQVCSDCVREETTGVLSVVDDNLFWHMVNAVKELSAQNAALEARLTALEAA